MKASVAGAVVMGLGGWFAEPYAQDWWLAGEACGGVLPTDAVQRLIPEDSHLAEEGARQVDGLGSYSCELNAEDDDGDTNQFIEATAYTRRDDQDREFMSVFHDKGWSPHAPLPEGMPGFIDSHGDIRLLLPCPDLDADVAGRPRTLLVSTELSANAKHDAAPQDAYQVAVALANSASERLGCGAKPVKVPDVDEEQLNLMDVEQGPERVPLSQVKGTACGWLAKAELPKDAEWEVAVRTNGSLPVSRCDVRAEGEGQYGDEQRLTFFGWYGDWSSRLIASTPYGVDAEATARCQGQAAHFRLIASDDVVDVDDAELRQMLETFARDEVRRHDCSDLRFTA